MTRRLLYPTIIVQASSQDGASAWRDAVADAWGEMPGRAQEAANALVASIVVVAPNDPRLNLGYTKEPRAALVGDALVLSCDEDARELWHEVAHVIVDKGLTTGERDMVDQLYSPSDCQQIPTEKVAEDFYFTVKGDRLSPFWQWWFGSHLAEGERMETRLAGKIAELKRTAGLDPLQIVEAVLDTFAEEFVFEQGSEEHVWYYGIAKDALKDAQKEDRLSYENRSAPHQYYYREDLTGPGDSSRKQPMKEPLRVERPDVTMRGTYTTPPMV